MRNSLTRYGINGLAFALLGPFLFWLLYPIGPIAAWITAESSCQILRYLSFRFFVFPLEHGFNVSPLRYIAASIPTSAIGFVFVALAKNILDRATLVIYGAVTTIILGYLINRAFYRKQR
jgi:hypothetical protein